MKRFVVVCRAPASTLFRSGDELTVPVEMEVGGYTLTFRTRHLDRGLSAAVPGDLWLHAEGNANTIEEAGERFVNVARIIGNIIGIGCNAYVGELEPELIYESTEGLTERPFFQRFVSTERPSIVSRFVDLDATIALIDAIRTSEEDTRILRAISQYMVALTHWRHGHSLLCVCHLFMAAEALARASWRIEGRRTGQSDEDLALRWGFDPAKYQNLQSFLDTQARSRLVFCGDAKCHAEAKKISDAFEHGFKGMGELHVPSDAVRIATADYLRKAILNCAGIPSESLNVLCGSKFDVPSGPAEIEYQLRGTLKGAGLQLAEEGNRYPCVAWVNDIKDLGGVDKEDSQIT